MSSGWGGGWTIRGLAGSVAELHGEIFESGGGRQAWFMAPSAPALVLGSAQRAELVVATELHECGLELVFRRSGGGAVLVDDSILWVDLFIGRDDPLWVEDVGVAFEWVGDLWKATLTDLSVTGLEVHRGSLDAGRWGRQVCFASLGPGEVLVDGKKVVGVSQRRTRQGARFQCSALLRNNQPAVADLLELDSRQRTDATREVASRSKGLAISRELLGAVLVAQLGGPSSDTPAVLRSPE